ncbi:alpha/beta hydrolase [Allomuricauda sp. d1]|uniref:alpha/beta hydrolase n=1 Tax=Allomuricauda sp. d1 TaxID=3136725 RepID=UPI0031CF0B63
MRFLYFQFFLLIFCGLISAQELKQINDLAYVQEGDSLQRLNLVLPEACNQCPLFIWIGGGAWSYGDKDMEMDLARQFATNGIAVASIGHRRSPATWRNAELDEGIQHPEHIKDVAKAVKYLFHNSAEYGYSQDRFFIGGYSSGAHLAALLDLNKTYLKEVGLPQKLFKGVVPISGTYDIVDYHQTFKNGGNPELAVLHVEAVFGDSEARFLEASPIQYLKSLQSPILFMSDATIAKYTEHLEKELEKTPFTNYRVIYDKGRSHGELWQHLSKDKVSEHRNHIVDFILNGRLPSSVK